VPHLTIELWRHTGPGVTAWVTRTSPTQGVLTISAPPRNPILIPVYLSAHAPTQADDQYWFSLVTLYEDPHPS
jgi:hypothetical protein